ncbi:hypothetical protein [Marinirhabdus gelatinilytica]|uniref:Uncharacterized protein n=1 Tax=Marinirhabdus gelatinilytica TaxID=1703343 RepID=A0A370QGK1_9FLAO|nr:hypothetical protein [Marinirhabdus gelatinilytica]RDK87190.1 hypothetical protein C8D94_102374 [Marinirhabdus gelatinilytica]
MELAKIEQLLEAYFEGNTTLEEEAILRAYFTKTNVAPHLQQYQPIFAGFAQAQGERSVREIVLPKGPKTASRWWVGIAATLLVAIGVFGFFNQEPTLTAEEKEALAAFEKTKEAFKLMSQNFNEGAEELVYIQKFKETKNKILK